MFVRTGYSEIFSEVALYALVGLPDFFFQITNAMKSKSEQFCKDCLERFIRKIYPSSSIIWENVEQNQEPPDYYLSVDETRFAVEITKLVRKERVGTEKSLPAGIIRDCLKRFVSDEIEGVARENGSLHGSYLVGFSKPITNFATVKNLIQSKLLTFVSDTQLADRASPQVVYKCNRQECQIEKLSNQDDNIIMGGPIISSWEGDAQAEVAQLIDDRLNEKKHRLRNINDPKILLLHNEYQFDNLVGIYKECILAESSLNTFHSVFVVHRSNEVDVLHSREPSWI
jgi:hypothetical protein